MEVHFKGIFDYFKNLRNKSVTTLTFYKLHANLHVLNRSGRPFYVGGKEGGKLKGGGGGGGEAQWGK